VFRDAKDVFSFEMRGLAFEGATLSFYIKPADGPGGSENCANTRVPIPLFEDHELCHHNSPFSIFNSPVGGVSLSPRENARYN
jgi:hypothetical protein